MIPIIHCAWCSSFPDPWHKRAIINAVSFRCRCRAGKSKLQLGHIPYGDRLGTLCEHMLEVMSSIDGYKNLSESNDYVPRPASRPVTKFEQRGHRLVTEYGT